MPASVAVLLAVTAGARGQAIDSRTVPVAIDSGVVTAPAIARGAIYEEVVRVPGAPWLRLQFTGAELGSPPAGGAPTVLRLTALADGAVQQLTADGLRQWSDASAYFNGEAVRLEIIADPGAAPSRVALDAVTAGMSGAGGVASICGPTDDRVLSSDARVGRVLPAQCTAWIIDDANHCLLTAGHCSLGAATVVQFDVPLSLPDGTMQHPPPADQYAVDTASVQFNNGIPGDDWAYFGCFDNTETGRTPFETQGAFFTLAATPPPVAGQTIRVTGHGTDASPPEWNFVQQTHAGPYVLFTFSVVRYAVDTTSGNSGSPVIDETTGEAIAIHTSAGCSAGGGSNIGTGVNNAGLQNALANPLGVCIPVPCPADAAQPPDGEVGGADLVAVILAWGQSGSTADVNGDGTVDGEDVVEVILAWGRCP